MLQLLSPLALVALASLAVPAIIHLWRPPAKTVRIGTLRFFSAPAVRRLTKLQWRERLLLLVRLLLLTTLALLLARPIWNKRPPVTPQRWVLIEPGVTLEGEALKRWRALDRAGFQTRRLTTGFPRASNEQAWSRPALGPNDPARDVWSLVRELDAQLPAGSELAIFSSNRISSLRGERPALRHAKVEWIAPVLPNESISTLVSAQTSERGEVHCVIQTSDATKTRRLRVTIPAASGVHPLPPPLDQLSIATRQNHDGGVSARIAGGEWLVARPLAPLNVLILRAGDRVEDARYLQAAINALGHISGGAARVETQPFAPATDPTRADWMVWLGAEPVPPKIISDVEKRGADLLQDAEQSGGSADAITLDWIVFEETDLVRRPIDLLRRTPPMDSGVSVWSDSFGRPLLTLQRIGRGRHWRFFSRFHPDWNDLPRSSALPAALRSLFRDAENDITPDLRRVDPTQARPAELVAETNKIDVAIPAPPERVNLRQLFWLIAVLLFAAERALSYRSAPAPATATGARPREETPAFAGHAA